MSCMISGDPNAPILVVGMAPNKDELEADSPLVGASGNLLWGAATRAGFTRADCYILNVIGELPELKKGKSKVPSPAQLEKYWQSFHEALLRSTAKVALLLGGDALTRVTGLSGIQGWRGYLVKPSECVPLRRKITEVVPYKTNGRGHKKGDPRTLVRKVDTTVPLPSSLVWMIPSLHPSFIMHTGFKATPMLMYDVARVGRALRDELRLNPPWSKEYAVAFDIETARSLAADALIVQVGICAGEYEVSLPWGEGARKLCQEILGVDEKYNKPKVAHNIGFDLPRLEAAGVDIPDPIFCTMFACQMLQPDIPKGLNSVASLYLDTPRWKHKREHADYNLLDVRRTRQLYDVVRAGLAETGQLEFFQGTVMPAVRTYIDLTKRGLKVNVVQQNVLRGEFSSAIQAARQRWFTYHPSVNPNSHVQLKELFYGKLAWPVQKDHHGKVSVDKQCLARLVRHTNNDPSLAVLISLRKLEDNAEYIEVPLDHLNCVHPSYVPASKDDTEEEDGAKRGIAGTGRPQAHDPNIMQVPKQIRTMYIAHRPGWSLVEFDFDTAELRVQAAVSGDQRLLDALRGPDLHQANADLWNCTRAEAKTVAYGTLYGMGARKLHGIFPQRPVAECQRLLDAFYETYPGLKTQKEKVISQIQKNRYLVNPFGRRRYFWNPKEETPAALDFIPQSTVADIVWSSVNGLFNIARSMGGSLLTTIHDSFLFEFPNVQGTHTNGIDPEAIAAIETYLTRPFDNVAPGFFLPVSYSCGPNWGSLNEMAEYSTEEPLDVA